MMKPETFLAGAWVLAAATPLHAQEVTPEVNEFLDTLNESAESLEPGEPIEGELTAEDVEHLADGSRLDVYRLQTEADTDYRIELTSEEFNAFLQVIEDETLIAENDDQSEDDTNAGLDVTGTGGELLVLANGYDADSLGAYTLSVAATPEEAAAEESADTEAEPTADEAAEASDSDQPADAASRDGETPDEELADE